MRILVIIFLLFSLGACDRRIAKAEAVVRTSLGAPQIASFRNERAKGDGQIVCGEVNASDRPEGGWRFFVAYVELGRAAVAPSAEVMTSAAELSNPLLKGEAARFYHTCD